jgi:bacillopeptidase F
MADKPKLDISSPHDGDKVNKNEISIQGSTDKDITVTINSSPVVVSAQQTFSYTIRLNEGDNNIHIQAEDDAGNIETKDLKITYQKDE